MELRSYVWLCVLLFAQIGLEVQSAKILAVFPFPGKSQYIFAEQYLKELARRQHNVTVINTFGSSEMEPNFRVIGATKIHELMAGKKKRKFINRFDIFKQINYSHSLWQSGLQSAGESVDYSNHDNGIWKFANCQSAGR